MATQITSSFIIIIDEHNGSFTVRAQGPNGVRVEPQPLDLEPIYRHNNTLRLLSKRPQRVDLQDLQALGQALYRAFFVPDIAIAFGNVQQSLKNTNQGIRIRIQTAIPKITRLPWELMHDGREFIALRSNFPIVRGTDDSVASLRTDVGGALRILYAWSNPNDLPQLRLQEPAEKIQDMLSEEKRIQFDILENSTPETLSSRLLDDYHILCFAGHATADHLYLENGDGHKRVSAQELAIELDGKPTRLVFLAACEAGGHTQDDLPGFAQTLAKQAEIPAVVAMQYLVNDREANLFTTRYFEALAKFRPVDVALAEARKAIHEEEQVVRDVFSPVLYLQTESSHLFRASRSWGVLALSIVASIAIIALGVQFLFFQPDRAEITSAEGTAQAGIAFAQETTQAESAARAGAVMTAEARATESSLAESEAQAQAQSRATAEAGAAFSAVAQATAEALSEQRARVSAANGLTTEALSLLEDRLDLGLILAVEAHNIADTTETRAGVYRALQQDPRILAFLHHPRGEAQVAFNPLSDRMLASGSGQDIILWDTETLQPQKTLTAQTGPSSGLFFDPAGEILASKTENQIVLWDTLQNPMTMNTLPIPDGTADKLDFSTDGQALNGRTNEGIVSWRLPSLVADAQQELLLALPELVLAHALTPDQGQLVTNSCTAIDFWVFSSEDSIFSWDTDHTECIEHLAFSPDGRFLVSGGTSSIGSTINNPNSVSLMLWDRSVVPPTGLRLQGHKNGILDLAFLPDSRLLATTGHYEDQERAINLWTIPDGSPVEVLDYPGPMNLSFSPSGKILAASYMDFILLWDIEYILDYIGVPHHGRLGTTLDLLADVIQMDFSQDGSQLATLTFLWDEISIWDANDNELTTRYRLEGSAGANADIPRLMDIDHNIYVEGGDSITIWELATGQLLLKNEYARAAALAFDPSGETIASAAGNEITLWQIPDQNNVQQILASLAGPISSLAFSPDGYTLASGTEDGEIILWDLTENEQPYSLNHGSEGVDVVAFSQDGLLLASGSQAAIMIWDISTGEVIRKIDEPAADLEFSADRQFLTNRDAVWDLQSFDKIDIPYGDPLTYRLIDFDLQNGRAAVYTSWRQGGGPLMLMEFGVDQWKKRACITANRNLTQEEWRRYFSDEPYRETCAK